MGARSWDRRAFVRRMGALGLAGPTLTAAGCTSDAGPAGGTSPSGDAGASVGGRLPSLPEGPPITRPLLLPWDGDAVRIAAPMPELPMAYVSRGLSRIFVDHDARDRVYWMLRAHISASTGVWRIPLPGDPPLMPIMPNDVRREFEERPIEEWDPAMARAEGDMRLRAGGPTRVTVDFSCVPMPGDGRWYGSGAWSMVRCGDAPGDGCREDLRRVGKGTRHTARDCSDEGTEVDVLTWACLDG